MTVPLATYLFLTFVLVLTPGATTAVVLRNTLKGGWRLGLATSAGAALGNSTHATVAGLGLALVFRRWPAGLVLLRWTGAAYLGWLAASSLRQFSGREPLEASMHSGRPDSQSSFRQGLTVTLLNPAIIVFYLAVVPTFVPNGAGAVVFAALAGIHVTMAFICHLGWAFAFDRLRSVTQNSPLLRVLDVCSAGMLLYLAFRTFLQS